jgi:hypothetical protein
MIDMSILSMNTCLQHMNASVEVTQSEVPWLPIVRQHVKSLDYGVVQIVVHGQRVVQIEKTEKVRLDKGGAVPVAPKAESFAGSPAALS